MSNTSPLRILSLSTVFPNRDQPGLGSFVRSRLVHMAETADVRAVAPCPLIGYRDPVKLRIGGKRLPAEEEFQGLKILRPRWLYPPNGAVFSARCLAWRLKPYLAKLRREFPFDIIDAHFGYPNGIAAAYLARWLDAPFAVTLRGNELWFSEQPRFAEAMQWSMREAACTIAVSEELRQLAISLGANEHAATKIPNGINAERFQQGDRQAIRERLGVKRKVILSVGELVTGKGHDSTLRALRQLLDEGHDAELRIAGKFMGGGPDATEQLEQLVTDLNLSNNVHFLGWIKPDEVADWHRAADVFCLATHSEGWPNVVQEALATGTPVVSTNVGAIPEMVPRDDFGFLVEPKDHVALADALRQTLSRDWDEDAIARWGQRRSWSNVGAEVVETLWEAAAAHKAARRGTARGAIRSTADTPAAQRPEQTGI